MSIIGKTRTNQPVEGDDSVLEEIALGTVEGAEEGTIDRLLGLDSEGGLVKGDEINNSIVYYDIEYDETISGYKLPEPINTCGGLEIETYGGIVFRFLFFFNRIYWIASSGELHDVTTDFADNGCNLGGVENNYINNLVDNTGIITDLCDATSAHEDLTFRYYTSKLSPEVSK